MLDTIALTLDRQQFEVLDPDRFSPSARGALMPPYYKLGARGNFSCVLNPTKSDLAAGHYGPRLTLVRRKVRGGFALTLRIEFSAPKLIFGNNFDELTGHDFEQVLDALHRSLAALGVRVGIDTLRGAKVSAIHYSKNMAFIDYTTCSMVMSELERIDLDRRLDLSQTDYRNEGHAIRYHANSYEVAFYDKLKDLERARYSEKRAIEDDYGPQLDIFADRGAFPRQLEVLRMEVRLGTRAKIKSVVAPIEPETEPTFAALFNPYIAKAVLMRFWKEVRSQMALVEQARVQRPEDLLALLAAESNGRARPGTLLARLGSLVLVGSVGFRGAGALMARHCSPRSWQRYKRQLKTLPPAEPIGFSALRQVGEALARFEPLRLADFRNSPTASSMRAAPEQSNKRAAQHKSGAG
jgi:hypothetical protein